MFRQVLANFISLIVKILIITLKVNRIGDRIDSPGVVAFLHGEQLPLLRHRPLRYPLVTPISLSRDGELQVKVMTSFGIEAVRGSTSRGGASVLRHLLKWFKRHQGVILIAIDGPRGPWGEVSPGALYLAKKLDVPLWFCRVRCHRAFRLSSWDHFMIPYPFSKITIETYRCEPKESYITELID
jgi:Kdo2-lipid IVA 3' secondary acyltransferase